MKKNVVLLGKGILASRVADWLYDSEEYQLLCVVPNNPPSQWTLRLEDWARGKGVLVTESGRAQDVHSSSQIDLAISVTYDKILTSAWIARCGKAINIHNAPLPEYRGVNPINWALKNGESEHGVTIHEITPGIDDGPILGITRFPINPVADEVIDVYERCINFGWKLFKELMPSIWSITPQPQDHSRARYYSAKNLLQLGDRSFFTRTESRKRLGIDALEQATSRAAGAKLLPGVRIGEDAIVGAGAVVTKDVADGMHARNGCPGAEQGHQSVSRGLR
jgi:hypothetical protein